jgi:hypothetical protein
MMKPNRPSRKPGRAFCILKGHSLLCAILQKERIDENVGAGRRRAAGFEDEKITILPNSPQDLGIEYFGNALPYFLESTAIRISLTR